MALNSIQQEWQGYAAMVMPKGAKQVQFDETKQAFFAGAWAILNTLEEIGSPHISEDQGVAYFEARRRECEEFRQRLMSKYVQRN